MEGVATALRRALGERVRLDAGSRRAHAHDAWVRSLLRDLRGDPPSPPLAVVEAASTGDVARTLALCREAGVAVVPVGGGSGVCGGVADLGRAVALSLRRLTGLVELDDVSLRARFRAGTNGLEAERAAQAQGLTIGHWPQSIELSTVGGWVATRATGQYSTAVGGIEDLLLDLEVVLPDGAILRAGAAPRAGAGPDLRQLFLGSEGTLGVVTEVGLSLRPLPEARQNAALHFADFAAGLAAARRIVRAGLLPPVLRLYDPRESRRGYRDFCPRGRALLLLRHEGAEAARVTAEAAAAAEIARAAGGEDADPAAVESWLAHRNRVPDSRELLREGLVFDTIEVSAPWRDAAGVYAEVTGALSEMPSMLAATAHAGHHYRSGTCLYFTFAARPDDASQAEAIYAEAWRRAMEATLVAGGSIAHHHGVGRVRRDWLAAEIGESGVAVLRALKRALDPGDLLNPGVLLPEPVR